MLKSPPRKGCVPFSPQAFFFWSAFSRHCSPIRSFLAKVSPSLSAKTQGIFWKGPHLSSSRWMAPPFSPFRSGNGIVRERDFPATVFWSATPAFRGKALPDDKVALLGTASPPPLAVPSWPSVREQFSGFRLFGLFFFDDIFVTPFLFPSLLPFFFPSL